LVTIKELVFSVRVDDRATGQLNNIAQAKTRVSRSVSTSPIKVKADTSGAVRAIDSVTDAVHKSRSAASGFGAALAVTSNTMRQASLSLFRLFSASDIYSKNFHLNMAAAAFALTAAALAASQLTQALAQGVLSAAELESRVVRVAKVTGYDRPQTRLLTRDIQSVAMTTGMGRLDTAGAFETAGALGIGDEFKKAGNINKAREELRSFTIASIEAASAFSMPVDAATEGLAKIGNVAKPSTMAWEEFVRRSASAIDILGNTTAARESEIVTSLKHMAGALSKYKPTPDVLSAWYAYSATLVAAGQTGDHAGEMLKDIVTYVQRNTDNKISNVLGWSPKQLDEEMKANAPGVIKTLAEIYAASDAVTRGEIGKALGRTGGEGIAVLAGSLDKLSTNVESSNLGFQEGNAIASSYSRTLETFNTQIGRLQEIISALTMPTALLNTLTYFLTILNNILEPVVKLRWALTDMLGSIPFANVLIGATVVLALASAFEVLLVEVRKNTLAMALWDKVTTMSKSTASGFTGVLQAVGAQMVANARAITDPKNWAIFMNDLRLSKKELMGTRTFFLSAIPGDTNYAGPITRFAGALRKATLDMKAFALAVVAGMREAAIATVAAMTKMLAAVWAFILGNPFTVIIGVIFALIAGFSILAYKLGYFSRAFDVFKESAMGKDLFGWIDHMSKLLDKAGTDFQAFVKEVKSGGGPGAVLITILETAAAVIYEVFKFIDTLYLNYKAMNSGRNPLVDMLMSLGSRLYLIMIFVEKIYWFLGLLKQVIESAWDLIREPLGRILDFLIRVWEWWGPKIDETVKFLSDIKSILGQLYQQLGGAWKNIEGLYDKYVPEPVKNAVGIAKDTTLNLAGFVYDNTIGKFINKGHTGGLITSGGLLSVQAGERLQPAGISRGNQSSPSVVFNANFYVSHEMSQRERSEVRKLVEDTVARGIRQYGAF